MPGRGTGLRRARNKAARLPRQWKQVMIGLLLEEEDFDDIAIAIAEAGCPAEDVPSRRAIATYYESAEYQAIKADWLRLAARGEERSALASALEAEGIEAAADLVTFEALDRMYRALRDGGDEVDPAKLANLAVAVKKSAAEQERAKLKAQIAALKARLESDSQQAKPQLDRKALVRELDSLIIGERA